MNNYYLHRNNENHGPYTEAQLHDLLSTGKIGPDELVCVEGGSDWVAASSLGVTVTSPSPPVQLTRPPKLTFTIVWLWVYVVSFTIVAIIVFSIFSDLTHKVTGEKTGFWPGVLMFCLIEGFAIAFAAIAIGLQKRKVWAHGMACRFMLLNIFSPLFIAGIIGLKQLNHEDTVKAFEARP